MKDTAAPTPKDAALVDFEQLYEAHFDYVYHSLRRLGAAPSDLEDLTQEVFMVTYRKLSTYDPQRPLKPWLFGIAFRVLSDRRKTKKATHEAEPLGEEFLDPAPTPDLNLEAHDACNVVHQALGNLELQRRAVFVLHDMQGETAPEIARTLDVPLNTVYSRLRLARKDFTEHVRRLVAQRALA